MRPRQHLTLMHGGRCPCPRCTFENRAVGIAVVTMLVLGALAWVVGA